MNKKVAWLLVTLLLISADRFAEAQQRVARIGYLTTQPAALDSDRKQEIRRALQVFGYSEGQNISMEYRSAEGKLDRLPGLAAELVNLKVDVILVAGGYRPILEAKNATKTIPIVMVGGGTIGRVRLDRKSCASRRKHHRLYKYLWLSRRQTVGAAEGSGSKTCPCRHFLRG